MCQEYNGWTNRETWALVLWINNDEGLQHTAMDYALTAIAEKGEGDNAALYSYEQALENWITEDLLIRENVSDNEILFSMLTDIGSLYRVNWREAAESLLEEAREGTVNA